MPVHDWTLVDAGIFHDFHCKWIVSLCNALNQSLLPPEYYALAEQVAGTIIPDLLTLHSPVPDDDFVSSDPNGEDGSLAVATAPPKVRFTAEAEIDIYRGMQRSLSIRHRSDDEIVAIVEIVSQGNKSHERRLNGMVDKLCRAITRGIHVLILDLQPPTSRDPQGIHGLLWKDLAEDSAYVAPADKPLTLAAYTGAPLCRAYVEPIAVGDVMPVMPLFLTAENYIETPLEATYQTAWRGVPAKWRGVLEKKIT